MTALEPVDEVDERQQLNAVLPAESDEDEVGESWTQGVAREWQAELADEREDVYTTADGEPIDEAR